MFAKGSLVCGGRGTILGCSDNPPQNGGDFIDGAVPECGGAGAIAGQGGGFYPLFLGALLFCAFSIATSRITLGMHFLSDVLAGAALGAGLGYASFMLAVQIL